VTDAPEEPLARPYDGALLRRILRYVAPHRGAVAGALALLVAGGLLALVGPWLTQQALDVAIPRRDGRLLALLTGAFVLSLLLDFVQEYAQTILTTRIGQRVMHDLRVELFTRLQRLSIPFFDRHPVGRLITRVTSDVETLNELFSSGLVAVFGDLFALAAIMVAMLVMDWRLALVAFAMIPFVWLVAVLFRRRVRDAFRDIRTRLARLNSFLQEHLSGMRVVQLFAREEAVARQFDRVNRDHLAAHLRSITIYAVFLPIIEVLTAVALASLLWYGGLRSLEATLSVGVLAAFIQLTRRFFQPLQDLSEKFNLLQSAMASSERIFALLDTPVEVAEPAVPAPLPVPLRGEVRFDGVWFRYRPDGEWVLQDVSFTASPGQTVAIVGHTGAGKTTIISLLLRFYEPERGRITLDGVDIRTLSLSDLRGAIGYVQQDLFLFAGDIQRNILLDAPGGPEAAAASARRTGADRFIGRLPAGYGHVLGERGRSLSVGERQLLSFARALARDPAILVLDEATSSVDAEAEARIQAAVAELMRGRTSLVVAHRLSTIVDADAILVLHHGRIRERGRHAALLAADGLYRRLVRLQFAAAATPDAA
jgi:ATP-binding cassette subfamily B protein